MSGRRPVLGVPPAFARVPGSTVRRCGWCSTSVSIAPSSVDMLDNGTYDSVICSECASPYIQQGVPFADMTEAQRDELRALGWPV